MTYLIGVDDAGRGPAIGPLILAGVLIKKDTEAKLKELGAKDSKLLSPKKRNEIFQKVKSSVIRFHYEITSPKEIDDCENLNDLEAIKTAMIINKLSEKLEGEIEAIIDCPSVNTAAWQAFLEKLVTNKKIKLSAEHKADFNHPVVSAASIIAKETREEQVEKIKKEFGISFGSGYPSDPKTVEFLEKNYNNPEIASIIRHSWGTIKNLNKGKNQKKLF